MIVAADGYRTYVKCRVGPRSHLWRLHEHATRGGCWARHLWRLSFAARRRTAVGAVKAPFGAHTVRGCVRPREGAGLDDAVAAVDANLAAGHEAGGVTREEDNRPSKVFGFAHLQYGHTRISA